MATAAMSRLETAISNIEEAGFFLGFGVPENDQKPYDNGMPAKRFKIDEDTGSVAFLQPGNEHPPNPVVSPTVDRNNGYVVSGDGGAPAASELDNRLDSNVKGTVKPELASTDGNDLLKSAVRRQAPESYNHDNMSSIHQCISALKSADTFSCGGRFLLNDADRQARLRAETSEKEIRDFGNILNLSAAEMLHLYVRPSPPNPTQDRGDHIASDLALDFRLGTSPSFTSKQADDVSFLDEIRQRCSEVFNVPSVSLRRRHLRIYSKGGFSRQSTSTPRVPQRTIATVIVCLPSQHSGGKLVISHLKSRKSFSFADRAGIRDAVQWAAFYSDCEYEIKKVKSGHQILVIYDACVECDPQESKRQLYKQMVPGSITPPPMDSITALVNSVTTYLSSASCLGLFTWYSYTLSAVNKAPLTLKGLDRYVYESLSPRFRVLLLPIIVRLPFEDDASRNIRIAAFTRDDIEYMEGVAEAPCHDELEPFKETIAFPCRSDIETLEFCANDDVETTYFYSAMIIMPLMPNDDDDIAEG
uniref:Uncharacterized protein n=1 Tax=Spongospora subterranea TaxID=70186 RepID=A0A0H5R8Z6_9EUKA|eukprot:CRZ10182.1 hypothetical protein [Spongospora subterranea]